MCESPASWVAAAAGLEVRVTAASRAHISRGGRITNFAGEAGFHGLKGDGGP